MTTRIMHMSVALDYLEEVTRADERAGKPQEFVSGDDGRPLSYVATLAHIQELRARGFEVFPPCDNPGPTGRCGGHS